MCPVSVCWDVTQASEGQALLLYRFGFEFQFCDLLTGPYSR